MIAILFVTGLAEHRENRRRAARQAGLQRRRRYMETLLQEEQTELASNPEIEFFLNKVHENTSTSSVKVPVNSISARVLAKAMWANTTITALDLANLGLSDHAGSYIARMLNRNSTLLKLELSDNNLGPRTCQVRHS